MRLEIYVRVIGAVGGLVCKGGYNMVWSAGVGWRGGAGGVKLVLA